jgi:hypothetical protein
MSIDVREVDPRKPFSRSAISKPVPFSPFRYLWLLLPIPLFCWYWAGEALHKLELDWLRAHPDQARPLAEICQAGSSGICELYTPVAFAHWLALSLLLFIPKFMLVVASVPNWSQRWQERVLRNASWLGLLGLLATFAMVVARGVCGALLAWFAPQIWWQNDTVGVQVAAVIGIIAVIRIPPHVKVIWQLWRGFSKSRTGKPVTPAEAPALWAMVNDACGRLGVAVPDYVVMGIVPDCRLELGKIQLQPSRQVLDGRTLYIGATLATSLEHDKLTLVIEHALLKSRGKYGAWLPAAEDWVESSEGIVKELKQIRAAGDLPSATDPALFCWEGWLIILKRTLQNFREEHAYLQKKGIEYEVEQAAPEVANLLKEATQAYRKDVFHLFIVNLSSGVHCPAVLHWFGKAFAQRRPDDAASHVHAYTSAALETELVLLEKEWLVNTSQATTPTDCWELRAA